MFYLIMVIRQNIMSLVKIEEQSKLFLTSCTERPAFPILTKPRFNLQENLSSWKLLLVKY